jgi:hypothetical protein
MNKPNGFVHKLHSHVKHKLIQGGLTLFGHRLVIEQVSLAKMAKARDLTKPATMVVPTN